nr:hypothetical protein LNSESKQC_LNSESKQC_CDS_0008 [Microvirus sp.]
MGFFGKLWNGIKTVGSQFWNGLTNGLGSVVGSGINAYSQAKTNESNERAVSATNQANKEMVESTNAANMTMNRENIAMQQQENEIARQREDNAVQRRAEDLSRAGLSKTLAAGQAASANAMQAGQNSIPMQSYEKKAFQKQAIKAELAGMDYNINQNNALKQQIETGKANEKYIEAQAEYQRAVTQYLEENNALPSSNDKAWLMAGLKELFPNTYEKLKKAFGLLDNVNSSNKTSATLSSDEYVKVTQIKHAVSSIGEFLDDGKFKFDSNASLSAVKRATNRLYELAKEGVLSNDDYMSLLNKIKSVYGDRFTYNW